MIYIIVSCYRQGYVLRNVSFINSIIAVMARVCLHKGRWYNPSHTQAMCCTLPNVQSDKMGEQERVRRVLRADLEK